MSISEDADNGVAADTGSGGAAGQSAAAGNDALSIQVVARMFKISTFALRFYEFRGLIRRQRVGREWVYSWSDCGRITLIIKARSAGLTVGELVSIIKAMDDRVPTSIADSGRRKCVTLIHALESRQQAIGNVLAELYLMNWKIIGTARRRALGKYRHND